MTFDEFLDYISQKIAPYSLSPVGEVNMAVIYDNYPMDLILECVDIGIEKYFEYNESGIPVQDSVKKFTNKLGGIVHNKSLGCVSQVSNHIKSVGKKIFCQWNNRTCESILNDYVQVLRDAKWTDEEIADDLKRGALRLAMTCSSWTQWIEVMCGWINDIKRWSRIERIAGEQYTLCVIPKDIYSTAPAYPASLCRQANASFEMRLYDCTLASMRKLLEYLIAETFRRYRLDGEITENGGMYYASLERMIIKLRYNQDINIDGYIMDLLWSYMNFGRCKITDFSFITTDRAIVPFACNYNKIVRYFMSHLYKPKPPVS